MRTACSICLDPVKVKPQRRRRKKDWLNSNKISKRINVGFSCSTPSTLVARQFNWFNKQFFFRWCLLGAWLWILIINNSHTQATASVNGKKYIKWCALEIGQLTCCIEAMTKPNVNFMSVSMELYHSIHTNLRLLANANWPVFFRHSIVTIASTPSTPKSISHQIEIIAMKFMTR